MCLIRELGNCFGLHTYKYSTLRNRLKIEKSHLLMLVFDTNQEQTQSLTSMFDLNGTKRKNFSVICCSRVSRIKLLFLAVRLERSEIWGGGVPDSTLFDRRLIGLNCALPSMAAYEFTTPFVILMLSSC